MSPTRREVPLRLKLQVALRQLAEAMGLEPDVDWQLDHHPALQLRPISDDGSDWSPHQHSILHLTYMPKGEHKKKTIGNGATTRGSDIGEIAHVKRLSKKEAEFRQRVLTREPGQKRALKNTIKGRSSWPKGRKMRSRPKS